MSVAATGAAADLRARYGGELDRRDTADTWRADELGVSAARGRATVSFSGISPLWFKEAAKVWSRQRLALNYAFNTVRAAALAFRRFSTFLASCRPAVERADQIDRALIEAYLAWLAPLPLAESTKALSRVFLRCFLEDNRRYFPPYDAVPVARAETLLRYPHVRKALEGLAGRITADEMREMNYAADALKQNPADIARRFVERLH